MQPFAQHLFGLRDNAKDAAEEACNRLISQLRVAAPDLGPAIAEVAHLQAYARWWTTLTNHIEHAHSDAVTALVRTRQAAHRLLLENVIPRSECPFTDAQAIANLEAARHFYHDTQALEIVPLPPAGPATPATGPAAPPPGPGPAIPPTGTYPAIDPRRSM
ncbi:hypothetical protein [Actinoallomurus rhizosphaericola]|uniref:hypothetical protein n=1 Tax=Actinoallomurus rhizosphaericola TaxID=2952536 RepID=UPI002092C0A2|nr:hypothetical protein [Actinoallomurus rhizosphaericola]MCO5999764.1 hypothetical protein [Actinoallomurus rhizosphaericola]